MKRKMLIGLGVFMALATAAYAGSNIVLTPANLYTMIEKLQIKTDKQTHVSLGFNRRLNALETRVTALEKEDK